jgi:Kef-type K+ transport system membrane component KefB
MSLGTLALIGLCGLAGPLLSALCGAVPAVVGEILAGIVIGRTGLGVLHTGGATLSFLSDVGFAMLMLSVSMNVLVREQSVLGALPWRSLRALAVAILARWLRRFERLRAFRHQGKRRHWAIDLRVALIVLFGLAWIARRTGASLLIAGLARG